MNTVLTGQGSWLEEVLVTLVGTSLIGRLSGSDRASAFRLRLVEGNGKTWSRFFAKLSFLDFFDLGFNSRQVL